MAPRLWGGGIFNEGARLVLDFAFNVVGCHRIEARAAIDNKRGNAVLRKLGARREGRLRAAFQRDEQYVDQYLWSILDSDWLARSAQPSER
jgi:RimJ/RimL family protein N-acetyltransferase